MTDFRHKVIFEHVVGLLKTPAALVVRLDGTDVVVPDGQIDDDSEVWRAGDEGKLVVSEWWAIERRLV